MTVAKIIFLATLVVSIGASAQAQFSPALLQNDGYWADGKAEFNIYAAEIVRDGIPRTCEVLHLLEREPFDPKQLVRLEGAARPDSIAVLKLNQILNLPTGLTVLQQMHSSFWRVDNAQLLKFSLTSSDSSAQSYREARRENDHFVCESRGDQEGTATESAVVTPPANGYFYDELPWLVRTLDFQNAGTAFEVQLTGSTMTSRNDIYVFKPAKISFTANARTIEVVVARAGGADHFTLDRDGPHLLREWRAADGNHLKLKRNLKVDYRNYTKPGDRERALNNPMLRLPD